MLASALALAVTTQSFSPWLPPSGSKTYSVGPQSDTIETMCEVSWRWSELEPSENYASILGACVLQCRGKKHDSHQLCDTTCDAPCKALHSFSQGPMVFGATYIDPLFRAFAEFGISPEDADGVLNASRGIEGYRAASDNPRNIVTYQTGHWNNTPCSSSFRECNAIVSRCETTYRLFRVTHLEGGKTVITEGPKNVQRSGLAFPDLSTIKTSNPIVSCACEFKISIPAAESTPDPDTESEHSSLPLDFDTPMQPMCVEADGTKHPVDQNWCDDRGLQIVCVDMNHCTIQCTKPSDQCSELCIPAGCELQCVDGSAQDEQIQEDVCVPVGKSNLLASLSPGFAVKPAPVDAFTMCINMHKKEPNKSLKYRLRWPTDVFRLALAQMAKKETRRGPNTQMRVWMVTDHASYAEIAKLLDPSPAPAAYIREYTKLSKNGFIMASDPVNLPLLDPALLITPGVEAEAMDPFARDVFSVNRAGIVTWLKGTAAQDLAEWLSSVPASKEIPAFEGFVQLLPMLGDDALSAAADMLVSSKLSAVHDDLATAQLGGPFAARLTQPCENALAEKCVRVMERYASSSAGFAVANADPSISKGLKDRLKKIGN